jgi:hypothetical protein
MGTVSLSTKNRIVSTYEAEYAGSLDGVIFRIHIAAAAY